MRLIDADEFLKRVKKDREHEIYLHSWTADDVLKRLDSYYAPTVEAIPKDQYETRLKADMVAMLTDIQLEIEENSYSENVYGDEYGIDQVISTDEIYQFIQQKIDALKAESEDKE